MPLGGIASVNVMTTAVVDFLVETTGRGTCKMGAVFPLTPLPFLPWGYRPKAWLRARYPSKATKLSPSSQLPQHLPASP